MKIGIIFCGYQNIDTVEKCLKPWIDVRCGIDEVLFEYACVSVPFDGYQEMDSSDDGTIGFIEKSKIMDIHFGNPKFISETQARGMCLDYLKDENCDYIWMVDLDEEYTTNEIKSIIECIKSKSNIHWFSINFKNLFDTSDKYIDGFCPPRIYKVNCPPFTLRRFVQDNDITYGTSSQWEVWAKALNNVVIPKDLAFPRHYTWLSNSRSKNKINYQYKRWGLCSYKWNEELGKIEVDEKYYSDRQLSIPEIHVDLD